MKLRVATIAALLIGILVAIVGIFPGSREAVICLLEGSQLPNWLGNWTQWGHRTPDPAKVNTPIETTRASAVAEGVGERSASKARPDGHRADDLLARSIARLEQCPFVAAKTRQSVRLYGKHLVGSGEYLEQRIAGTRRFRVELRMQVGDEARTLLHVCDGRYLWRCESYKGKGTADRVDLARAARVLDASAPTGQDNNLGWWNRLGGLSELLRDIRDWFQFTSVAETKLADQTPVLRLDGTWKADRLAALIPDGRLPSEPVAASASRLPEHLPDRVVLFLGRDDLFPFRVEYRRRTPQSLMRGAEDDSAMVVMDLYLASFDVPAIPPRFDFNPGNLEHSDQTDRFLQGFGVGKKP